MKKLLIDYLGPQVAHIALWPDERTKKRCQKFTWLLKQHNVTVFLVSTTPTLEKSYSAQSLDILT